MALAKGWARSWLLSSQWAGQAVCEGPGRGHNWASVQRFLPRKAQVRLPVRESRLAQGFSAEGGSRYRPGRKRGKCVLACALCNPCALL